MTMVGNAHPTEFFSQSAKIDYNNQHSKKINVIMIRQKIIPFSEKVNYNLTKQKITVLQINLGRKCNLACSHCHVEASPYRTEELSPEICAQLVEIIKTFPQIKTIDLTGGAPEMNYGFQELVETARANQKEVIVSSNLTVFF